MHGLESTCHGGYWLQRRGLTGGQAYNDSCERDCRLIVNPEDVPALALSFEWCSKAWWPRARVEEFARTYGKRTTAETARMIDRCMEAVAAGSRLVEQMAAQIKGFGDMESKLAALWWKRMMAFGA